MRSLPEFFHTQFGQKQFWQSAPWSASDHKDPALRVGRMVGWLETCRDKETIFVGRVLYSTDADSVIDLAPHGDMRTTCVGKNELIVIAWGMVRIVPVRIARPIYRPAPIPYARLLWLRRDKRVSSFSTKPVIIESLMENFDLAAWHALVIVNRVATEQ